MANPKRIVVLGPDGNERLLADRPTYEEAQQILGCDTVEWVRVLREDLPGFTFTYLLVDEMFLSKNLPRNERASQLYQANAKRQFPDSDNPNVAIRENAHRHWASRGATVFSITPDGYDESNPPICGIAIWFDGYTCEELDHDR